MGDKLSEFQEQDHTLYTSLTVFCMTLLHYKLFIRIYLPQPPSLFQPIHVLLVHGALPGPKATDSPLQCFSKTTASVHPHTMCQYLLKMLSNINQDVVDVDVVEAR